MKQRLSWRVTQGLAVFCSVLAACGQGSADVEPARGVAGGVRAKTICFTAHNGVDPDPVAVTATLFHRGAYRPQTPVIIAIHGLAGNRAVWDGGPLGADAGSLARDLAGSGYVVIAYDRIGYGDSRYDRPRGGHAITLDTGLETLREVVQQVRDGSYTETAADCATDPGSRARFGSSEIVLMGHSAGGYLAASYAGEYRGVRGVVAIGAGTTGPSSEFGGGVFVPFILPQSATGDYVARFFRNPSECARFFFHVEGERASRVCAVELPTPSGDVQSIVPFTERTKERIAQIEPSTGVLIVYGEHDRIFKGPAEADANDPDHQTPDLAYWADHCPCKDSLGAFTQPASGHMVMFEATVSETSAAIVAWLEGMGL